MTDVGATELTEVTGAEVTGDATAKVETLRMPPPLISVSVAAAVELTEKDVEAATLRLSPLLLSETNTHPRARVRTHTHTLLRSRTQMATNTHTHRRAHS